MCRSARFGCAVVLLSVAAARNVQASETVFSNFDAGTNFDQFWVTSNIQNPTAEFEMAVPFTVSGSGGDFLLDSMVLPILANPGLFGPPQSGTSAYVSLYADGAGVPGALLESSALIDNLAFSNGSPPFPPPVTIPFSSTTTLLSGQTYWIGVAETGGTAVGWQSSPDISPLPLKARFVGTDTWNDTTSVGLGVQVFGTPVPGPSAIAMLAVAVGARQRRRRLN